MRDFKSFTSKELLSLINSNLQESRREWLMNTFEKAGKANPNNDYYQFWQQHNPPIQLWTPEVIQQKIDYIHDNPVVAGFVDCPHEYLYSSARDYSDVPGLVKVSLA